jgi:hypothetical protein
MPPRKHRCATRYLETPRIWKDDYTAEGQHELLSSAFTSTPRTGISCEKLFVFVNLARTSTCISWHSLWESVGVL